MQPAVLVRLRPLGPWRIGSAQSSAPESSDTLFHSDRLYSALTLAFADLGLLNEWLDATARAEKPAVRLSSLFPSQGDTLFAAPPQTLWPPLPGMVTSPSPLFLAKLRWSEARFVPVALIQSLASGQPVLADQWSVDAESGCLLRRDRPSVSPFRYTVRRRAAVDRLTRVSPEADSFACIEFESSAGLWTAITFADASAEEQWCGRVEGAFRLLADTGFGGGRRVGWGQVALPSFERGAWPAILLPRLTQPGTSLYWLLSLYSPAAADRVNWKEGDYRIAVRHGRGASSLRMVEEGSVVAAAQEPVGCATDIAREGAAHPVYRAGFALAVALPEMIEPSAPEMREYVEEPSPEREDLAAEDEPAPVRLPEPFPESADAAFEQSE